MRATAEVAKVLGAYAPDDLAVVTIGAGHNVKLGTFADSANLAVGDTAMAAISRATRSRSRSWQRRAR